MALPHKTVGRSIKTERNQIYLICMKSGSGFRNMNPMPDVSSKEQTDSAARRNKCCGHETRHRSTGFSDKNFPVCAATSTRRTMSSWALSRFLQTLNFCTGRVSHTESEVLRYSELPKADTDRSIVQISSAAGSNRMWGWWRAQTGAEPQSLQISCHQFKTLRTKFPGVSNKPGHRIGKSPNTCWQEIFTKQREIKRPVRF